MKKAKTSIALALVLFLFVPHLYSGVSAQAAKPNYRVNVAFDNSTSIWVASVYVTDGIASVGQLGLHYDKTLLSLCDTKGTVLKTIPDVVAGTTTSYLPEVVLGDSGIAVNDMSKASKLIDLTAGNLYFSWYKSTAGYVDATSTDKRIVRIYFRLAPGTTADKYNTNMLTVAVKPQDTEIVGWTAGAMLIDDNSNEYTNTATDSAKKCTVTITIVPPTTNPGGGNPGGGNPGSGHPSSGGGTVTTTPQKYTAQFLITDSENKPVSGAVITLSNGTTLQTDANGSAQTESINGTYTYTVTKESFEQANGTLTVNGIKVTQTVVLSKTPLPEKQHKAYVSGLNDGTFLPDKVMTRAEAATMLSRLSDDFNETKTYTVSFSDITPSDWFTPYVGYCVSTGMVNGYPDQTFRPAKSITRAEFAKIVCVKLGLQEEKTAYFHDVTETHWGYGFIGALKKAGFIGGYNDGTFLPDKGLTRAEAVKILNAAMGRTPDKAKIDAYLAENKAPFSDVDKNHWAFNEILEAAIPHGETLFHTILLK